MTSHLVRRLLAMLAWLLAVAILGPLIFFVAIVLAGPHSSMLPSAIQRLVIISGWVVFLTGPVFVARWVWRRSDPASSRLRPPEMPTRP